MKEAIKIMNSLGSERKPFLFIIDFAMQKPLIFPKDKIPLDILYDINGISNISNYSPISESPYYLNKKPIDFNTYKKAFDKVIAHLHYGNSYLLNLTQPTAIETNLDLSTIFHKSIAKYKLLYKDKFVVFSPEIFIRINNNIISSFPMKGTIDAEIPDAENVILNDCKETAEHYTIVDLIRNDLSKVSKNVKVDRFRFIDYLKTNNKQLLQVSSEISGELPNDYNNQIGEILFNLLPAGSISGAPKKKTLEIISETENYNRGYYTGVFGYFDGYNLDSGVMIRFIEKIDEGLIYKSGGGITAKSEAENEYQELIDKVYVPFARNN